MQVIPEAVFFEQSQFSLQYKKLSASIQQIVGFVQMEKEITISKAAGKFICRPPCVCHNRNRSWRMC